MGNGASGKVAESSPMYAGYSGHPRTGEHPRQQAQNPRSRGPRSFDELENDSHYNGRFAYPPQHEELHGKVSHTQHGHQPASQTNGKLASTNHQAGAQQQQAGSSHGKVSQSQPKANSQSTGKGKQAKLSSNTTHPALNEDYTEDNIIFETFYHRNGETHTCMYQTEERFMMNSWAQGEWLPFPKEWYDEGFLETDNVVRGGENAELDQFTLEQIVYGKSAPSLLQQRQNHSQTLPMGSNVITDDREGQIKHPHRGIVPTYMIEEKRNIHYYFDDGSGAWVKLPIAWELNSNFIKGLVSQVEQYIPGWTDKHDIMAALRASNYDVNDCVNTYWTIGDQGSMAAPRSSIDEKIIRNKDARIEDLEKRFQELNERFTRSLRQIVVARDDRETAVKSVCTLLEKVAELEVATQLAKQQVATLTTQLIHYKDVESKQQHEELDGERGERFKAEEKAKVLNNRIKNMSKESQVTKEELDRLKEEADDANRKVMEYQRRAEDNKKKAQEEAEKHAGRTKMARGSVDKKIVKQCANHAGLVAKAYHTLRMEIVQGFSDCDNLLTIATEAALKLPKLSDLPPPVPVISHEEMEDLKALYRKECLQRRLLYNQLQELRGNIRVYARCRYDSRVDCVLQFPTEEDIAVTDGKGGKKSFRFDRVYSPQSTQDEETSPIVTSCADGYNVCILAYGQTGSGKTFTMMGPPDNPGVNIRAISELLHITNERQNIEYELKVSMVEIYNEVIQDLLTDDCKVVTLQQVRNQVNIQGLTEQKVKSKDDIVNVMNMGMTNRTVASTKMNSESSRSHLLVVLTVEGRDKTSGAKTKSTLTLVDLAGSERVSKTEASGQRLVEAAAINKSLTALGQVFAALGQSAMHVPFRNCKLTQMLQPSLSGNAKAAMFVAVSPAENNLSETISTLTFGSNAKQVELGQAKKCISKGPPKR